MTEEKSNTTILDWLFERRGHIDTAELESVLAWKKVFDGTAAGGTRRWTGRSSAVSWRTGPPTLSRPAMNRHSGAWSPSLPADAIVSFCVTEEKGGHPSSIQSSLKETGPGDRLDPERRQEIHHPGQRGGASPGGGLHGDGAGRKKPHPHGPRRTVTRPASRSRS